MHSRRHQHFPLESKPFVPQAHPFCAAEQRDLTTIPLLLHVAETYLYIAVRSPTIHQGSPCLPTDSSYKDKKMKGLMRNAEDLQYEPARQIERQHNTKPFRYQRINQRNELHGKPHGQESRPIHTSTSAALIPYISSEIKPPKHDICRA